MSKDNPQKETFGAYEVKERHAKGWGRCIDTTHIADDGTRTIIQSTVGLSNWIWPHVWAEKTSQARTWAAGDGVKHTGGKKITGADMVKQAHDRKRAMEKANERARNWVKEKAKDDAIIAAQKAPPPPPPPSPRYKGTKDDPYVLTKGERMPVAFIFDGGVTGEMVLRVYKNKPSYDPKKTKLPPGGEFTTGTWRDNPRWAEMKLDGVVKRIWWRT